VPYPVLVAEPALQNNNTCKTTATYTDLDCVRPPEKVELSWFVQSIDAIQDVDQIFTLNMVLNLRWRDWRLAYAEGGFGCNSPVRIHLLKAVPGQSGRWRSLRIGCAKTEIFSMGRLVAYRSLGGAVRTVVLSRKLGRDRVGRSPQLRGQPKGGWPCCVMQR
jgi:hypothetical protein